MSARACTHGHSTSSCFSSAGPASWALETLRVHLSEYRPRAPGHWTSLLTAARAEVRRASLPAGVRGTVDVRVEGSLIEVSEDLGLDQQSFTLAHELAHILVIEIARQPGGAPWFASLSHGALEATCDLIARELTLPSIWMHPFLRTHGLRLGTLLAVARQCSMPLGVVVTRTVELGAPTAYLSATRAGNDWIITDVIGLTAHHARSALDSLQLGGFREGLHRLTSGASRELDLADSELLLRGPVVEVFGHRRKAAAPSAGMSPTAAAARRHWMPSDAPHRPVRDNTVTGGRVATVS